MFYDIIQFKNHGGNEMNGNNDTGFDYNGGIYEDDELRQKKKKKTKVLFIVLIVAAVVFVGASLAAGILNRERPQTFEITGLQITLTNKFQIEKETQGDYYLYLESNYVACEIFAADPIDIKNMEEAKDFYKREFDLKDVQLYKKDGLTYFTCREDFEDGEALSSTVFMYEHNGYVYMVWFATHPENMEDFLPQFREWAQTVVLD